MGIDVNGVDNLQAELEEMDESLSGSPKAAVGSSANHARDVEFGTDPHTIEADTAEALHFEWRGEEMYVASVDHPGTPAQPYMRPAAMEVNTNAEEYVEDGSTLQDVVRLAAIDGVRFAKRNAPVDDGDLQNSIRWEWL